MAQASSTVAGILNVNGSLNASNTLTVANLASLNGGYVANGSSTVIGNFNITGALRGSSSATSTLAGGLVFTGGNLQLLSTSCSGSSALTTDATGNILCGAISASNVSGFTDTGTIVELQTLTDQFVVGTSSVSANAVATIGATSTGSINLALRTLDGQTRNALIIQDAASTTVFALNTTGGFLAQASSTVAGSLQVAAPLSASSTLTVANLSILGGVGGMGWKYSGNSGWPDWRRSKYWKH